MNTTIEVPASVITRLIDDLETGWIANPSKRAEQKREQHLKRLRAVVQRAQAAKVAFEESTMR